MVNSQTAAISPDDSAVGGVNPLRLSELVLLAARRFHRDFSAQLSPLGVTVAQAQVLRIVAVADAPLRMVDIAAKLEIVPRSATSKIDALESLGLVERLSDNADRRSVSVAVTEKGRKILSRLDEVRRSAAEELLSGLAVLDREELYRLLSIVSTRTGFWAGIEQSCGSQAFSVTASVEGHDGGAR